MLKSVVGLAQRPSLLRACSLHTMPAKQQLQMLPAAVHKLVRCSVHKCFASQVVCCEEVHALPSAPRCLTAAGMCYKGFRGQKRREGSSRGRRQVGEHYRTKWAKKAAKC